MRHAQFASLWMLLSIAFAPPAAAEQLPLGELTLTYDAGAWEAEPLLEDSLWRLTCVSRHCRGRTTTSFSYLYVFTLPASRPGASSCRRPASLAQRDAALPTFTTTTETYGGVPFNVTISLEACRAVTPWLLEACGAYGPTEYWITTGFGFGTNCGPEPKLPVPVFRDLLGGISFAGGAP
jgi:hypothetical protein